MKLMDTDVNVVNHTREIIAKYPRIFVIQWYVLMVACVGLWMVGTRATVLMDITVTYVRRMAHACTTHASTREFV